MREVNKKGLIFGILFSMFLFSNFAFALEEVQYSTSPSAVWDMATSAVGNVFSFLVLETSLDHETVFAKSLLFILLYFIVFAISKKIPLTSGSPLWLQFGLSLVISMLAIRTISADIIQGILLPYTALGISITTILPFIFMFYFLHNVVTSKVVRKLGWVFFSVVMLGLWVTRSQSGDISDGVSAVYLGFGIISLIMLWFDGTIHKYLAGIKHGKIEVEQAMNQIDLLLNERALKLESLRTATTDSGRTRIKNKIKSIDDQLGDLRDFT